MRRALILAGGDPAPPEFIRSRKAGLLICADGGLALALMAGLTPDVLVGDMDSVSPQALARLEARGVEILRHPCEKDKSDLELALEVAAESGAEEVEVIGAVGGRLDHELVNLLGLLPRGAELGLQVVVSAPDLEVFLATGEHRVEGKEGWICSLVPVTDAVRVTLEGLQYGLHSGTLRRASTRGLSNRIQGPEARIAVEEGQALAILVREA